MIRIGILTVSDRSAQGDRADASGPLIAEIMTRGLESITVVQQGDRR